MRKFLLTAYIAVAPIAAHADLSISSKPTSNVTCSRGTCTATAEQAVLNADDLSALLAAGNVTVKTGGGAETIQVTKSFAWSRQSRLTLDAAVTVGIHSVVAAQGRGALSIVYNDGGQAGDLKFFDKGKIDFWDSRSRLIVNGTRYTLATSIADLAEKIASRPHGFYALAKDYDARPDGLYVLSPIVSTFQGMFEGLGHRVIDLAVHARTSRCVGFFAHIGDDGSVRDIGFSRAKILLAMRATPEAAFWQAATMALSRTRSPTVWSKAPGWAGWSATMKG